MTVPRSDAEWTLRQVALRERRPEVRARILDGLDRLGCGRSLCLCDLCEHARSKRAKER